MCTADGKLSQFEPTVYLPKTIYPNRMGYPLNAQHILLSKSIYFSMTDPDILNSQIAHISVLEREELALLLLMII